MPKICEHGLLWNEKISGVLQGMSSKDVILLFLNILLKALPSSSSWGGFDIGITSFRVLDSKAWNSFPMCLDPQQLLVLKYC